MEVFLGVSIDFLIRKYFWMVIIDMTKTMMVCDIII
jgi:hypothetical protein